MRENGLITRRAMLASVAWGGSFLAGRRTVFADAEVVDGATSYGIIDATGLSESEIDDLIKRQIDMLINEAYNPSSGTGMALRPRPRDEVVYGPKKTVSSGFRFISGQLAGGYSFNTRSSIYCATSGGSSVSLSFGFPAPWGTVSTGVSFGRVVSSAGVAVGIPGDGRRYKVQMSGDYTSQAYQVYHYDAYGKRTIRSKGTSYPILVARDFRAVRV